MTVNAAPSTFMLKPVGADCNLSCSYCYYGGEAGTGSPRMSMARLEAILSGLLPHAGDLVSLCWQGGEPMLAGLDFFTQALELQVKHQRPGQQVRHALMTNGTLLTEEWCRFLLRHEFLVGVSIDGGKLAHNRYRIAADGRGSYDDTARGVRLLQRFRVPYNLLAVITDANVDAPKSTWEHLCKLGGDWLQVIPAVEWRTDPASGRRELQHFVVEPGAYGRFLVELFDLWAERSRRRVSVRLFDSALTSLVLGSATVCTQARRCHDQLTIEADGSVYACDHFAGEPWRLGRVEEGPGETRGAWLAALDWPRFHEFAARKAQLAATCERCDFLRFCYGGCPKHRLTARAPTVLCEATKLWLSHALPRLEELAVELRRGLRRPPQRASKRQEDA